MPSLPQGTSCGNIRDVRALVYTRVSTSMQAESGLGMAAQENACRAEAARRQWDVIDVVTDAGESGGGLNRPGVQEVFKRLVAGEADVLLVAKLDRLSRSVADFVDLLQWTEKGKIALVALDLGLDTSTSAGRLVATVMAAVGQWERETIGTRTREAADVRRQRGSKMGRDGVRDTRPELAERISTLRASGSTWQSIADVLNDEKVPTVRGGTQWRVSSVQAAAGYVRPPSPSARVDLPPWPARRRKPPTPTTPGRE
jgi:DNA invertase Pin-like site-specific DNA recombinase